MQDDSALELLREYIYPCSTALIVPCSQKEQE
jgi:hypothetical protein